MTSAAAIRTGAGERWLGATAPIVRVSRPMAMIAGASLLGHLLMVGSIGVAGRTAVPPPTEIAVEIVQEVPKAPEPAKPPPEPAKEVKPEPVKSEPTKPEITKPEIRPNVTKIAKSEPRAPRPAPKVERKIAVAPPSPARDLAAEERKLTALQQELESLRAEQAQLRAARAAEADVPMPVAMRDTGMGLLPGSFQAVALPNTTDGAGDATSYEAIVFSALAKAKGIGRRQGVPGTAGVRFSVDPAGRLVAVELIHWSGIPDLDSEALAVVRRAIFPPPPQGAQRTFVANVNFEVERTR